MAGKNANGKIFSKFKNAEERLLRIIDKRTDNGKDRENVDPVWQKHKITAAGERVWSF